MTLQAIVNETIYTLPRQLHHFGLLEPSIPVAQYETSVSSLTRNVDLPTENIYTDYCARRRNWANARTRILFGTNWGAREKVTTNNLLSIVSYSLDARRRHNERLGTCNTSHYSHRATRPFYNKIFFKFAYDFSRFSRSVKAMNSTAPDQKSFCGAVIFFSRLRPPYTQPTSKSEEVSTATARAIIIRRMNL